jgi:TPR repeat protein
VCYFFGEGVSRNVAKAKQLLEQAAAGNSVEIKAQAEELLAQIPN